MYRTPLAWRNLTHNKRRLALSLAGIAFAVLLMFMEFGFLHGFNDSMTQMIPRFNGDLIMISKARVNLELAQTFSRNRLYQAMEYQGVRSICPLYVKTALWKVPETGEPQAIQVFAYPPGETALLIPEIAPFREALKLPGNVLFDSRSRPYFGRHAPGTVTELGGKMVRVIGEVPIGVGYTNDGNLVMSNDTCFGILGGKDGPNTDQVELGLIRVEPGTDPRALQAVLRKNLPDDVDVMTREELASWELAFYSQGGGGLGFIFGMGAMLGFTIGVIVCYQILFNDIADNRMQFATLKAIGHRNGYLVQVVLQQALYLAVLGFGVGVVGAKALYLYLEQRSDIAMVLTVDRAATVLVMTVVMCLVAGLIAVRKVILADPAECF